MACAQLLAQETIWTLPGRAAFRRRRTRVSAQRVGLAEDV